MNQISFKFEQIKLGICSKMAFSWLNTSIFISVFFSAYIAEKIGPNKVGFWCNDESIRHDLIAQTIDFRLLLFIVIVMPLLVFLSIDRKNFSYELRNYLYGFFINILLTIYCKSVIGRPRPNFYALCLPKWNSEIECKMDEKYFISNYNCTNKDDWLKKNSNQSFFSGHSALGTYSSFYLIFYLNTKLDINGFLKAHIFFIIFMIGLFPGLTQYLNFWHHASDVVTGDLIGILLALFAYYGIQLLDKSTFDLQNKLSRK